MKSVDLELVVGFVSIEPGSVEGAKEVAMNKTSLRPNRKRGPTPYPDLDEVLRRHAKTMGDALGTNFVGYYLQGSLAIGDFDLTSDVDLIVVVRTELAERQAKSVELVHQQTYAQDNRWVKRLEYSFFPQVLLRKPSSPYDRNGRNDEKRRALWYFDNGSPTIERSDHCNTLVVRWTLRERGVVVAGPAPTTLIDPVSPQALREEIRNTLTGWGRELLQDPEPFRNRFYQVYLVLNYCRMLHDLNEGRVDSKYAAVEWARSNLDRKWTRLIDSSWKDRQECQDPAIAVRQPADPVIFDQTLSFVRYAIEKAATR